MKATDNSPLKNSNLLTLWYIYLPIIIMLALFAVDLVIPLGVAFGVLYALPVLITLKSNNNKITILFAILTTVLTLIGYYNSPSGGELWKVIFNRSISIFIIWSAALSILYYYRLVKKSIELNNKLTKNNLQLNNLKNILYETNTLAKVGSWELNLETMGFFWSDTIKEILEEPLTSNPSWETSIKYFEKGEKAKRVYDITKKTIVEGTSFDITTQVFTAKGKPLWIRVIGKTEVKKEKRTRLFGSLQDVTKEKQLEEKIEIQNVALKESEEKYRVLFEDSSTIILQIDFKRKVIENCSIGALRFYGYSKEEMVGKPVNSINVSPENQLSLRYKNFEKHNALNFETQHILKNGNIRDVELHTSKIKIADGIKLLKIVNDITDRKIAERKLKITLEENKDIKIALNRSAILAYTDIKGKITYVNDKFIELSQYSKEELIGADHRILNSGHHSKEFMKNLWTIIKSGEVWVGEIKNKTKKGSFYWVQTTIVPSVDENGKIAQFITIRYDITDRKKAELAIKKQQEELENKNVKLEKIAWSFSHNVRAPIVTIMGLSNIFNYENECDEINKEVLDKISVPIKSLDDLVSSIVKEINDIN